MRRSAGSGFRRRGVPAAPRDRGLALLACFKIVKAVLLVAVGLGALKMVRPELAGGAREGVAALGSGADRRLTREILEHMGLVTPGRLRALGAGAFLFATLYSIEAFGLWQGRRWAGYLTMIATAAFVPFEVYEILRRFTPLRLSALVVNLALVAYLLYRLRRE